MLKGVILSEIDSRNGPIKLAYFVKPCSKQVVASTMALPTSFRTASLKSALGKGFLSAEGRDSK